MNRSAFSLVELSIVLVILGLLVGGILAGQSLIRASELRAVSVEFARYSTAISAFRDKYFAVPGDFSNATAIWGIDTSCSGAATPGTCNGNGDGILDSPAAASQTGEVFRFWQQLALAGLVEGTYSGNASTGGATHAVIGSNIPASKLPGAGWSANYSGPSFAGSTASYQMNYGNNFWIGGPTTNTYASAGLLKPEEAWNIDTKMDDGMPARGKVILTYWTQCSTSATKSDFNGLYKLDYTGNACTARFITLF